MSENNEQQPPSGGIVRLDGMSADAKQLLVKIYETEFPMPSDKIADIRQLCMRQVMTQHPLTGVKIPQVVLGLSADTALVVLELHYALKERDAKIESITERLAELERRFEDPAEHDKQEGYDGVG